MPRRRAPLKTTLSASPEDAKQRLLRRERLQLRQRRAVLTYLAKVLIWAVGGWTVREFHAQSFQMYLIISILLFIYANLQWDKATHPAGSDAADPAESREAVDQSKATMQSCNNLTEQSASGQSSLRAAERQSAPPPPTISFRAHAEMFSQMERIGTPAAIRCVIDPRFRSEVLEAQLSPRDSCLCGSGEPFRLCCKRVQSALNDVLGCVDVSALGGGG